MKKFAILILLSCFMSSCSTKKFSAGKYAIKQAYYGKFISSIDLKQDSTFIKNFRGDFMNDNSYGTWVKNQDTLYLYFDTITYPQSRYRHPERYIVKGNKLMPTIGEQQLKQIKEWLAWDSLSNYQQKKILKVLKQNSTMVNFRGKMRKNFYVKVE